MLFQDRQSIQFFAVLPRFLEDLLQSEDLIRGAATRTQSALTSDHIPVLIPLFSAFLFKAFGVLVHFLGKLRSYILLWSVHCLGSFFLNIGKTIQN